MLFGGRVFTTSLRCTVRETQCFPELLRLSQRLEEAMDYLYAMAEKPIYHLGMAF